MVLNKSVFKSFLNALNSKDINYREFIHGSQVFNLCSVYEGILLVLPTSVVATESAYSGMVEQFCMVWDFHSYGIDSVHVTLVASTATRLLTEANVKNWTATLRKSTEMVNYLVFKLVFNYS